MKTKKNSLLVGALVAAAPAMAGDEMPEICNSAVNYAVQVLNLGLSQGGPAEEYNPDTITLKKDFSQYPIQNVKYLGSCGEEGNLKDEWCEIAGGPASVYRVEVGQVRNANNTRPLASVVVTYNRGGCKVGEVSKKPAWRR